MRDETVLSSLILYPSSLDYSRARSALTLGALNICEEN
jgi:hypothetical protein